MNNFIITVAVGSERAAIDEIHKMLRGVKLERWLADGVGLLQTEADWGLITAALDQKPPIFIRHICPVQKRVQSPGNLDTFESAVPEVLLNLDTTRTFSVQARLFIEGDWGYSRVDVHERFSKQVEAWGAKLDVKHPEQILSVVVTEDEAFIGFSLAWENLSNWAGGERRFKREEGQVSRAEFKLLEALDVFGIELKEGGSALDMGAAPGGWTRILAESGLKVVAVDPAKLDPRISRHPDVTHVRKTVQDFNAGGRTFDVITNDMRMDARDTARIMLENIELLKENGIAIVTLKLPEKRMAKTAKQALDILKKAYKIVGARQLFHNRNEVTVVVTVDPEASG
jgi:23S rRNA (cytidine2498-2'-O)-methyltransferase